MGLKLPLKSMRLLLCLFQKRQLLHLLVLRLRCACNHEYHMCLFNYVCGFYSFALKKDSVLFIVYDL